MKYLNFVLLLLGLCSASAARADHLSFSHDIYPLLEENCLNCHHNPGAPLGLSMVTHEEIMRGSVNGPVVIPGQGDRSEILLRVTGKSHPRMPMNGPPYLSDLEIELIRSWIDAGAKDHDHQ